MIGVNDGRNLIKFEFSSNNVKDVQCKEKSLWKWLNVEGCYLLGNNHTAYLDERTLKLMEI